MAFKVLRSFKGHDPMCTMFYFQNFVQIEVLEVRKRKMKHDGMLKSTGRDCELFSFWPKKMADPQNPGTISKKSLRYLFQKYFIYFINNFSSEFGNIVCKIPDVHNPVSVSDMAVCTSSEQFWRLQGLKFRHMQSFSIYSQYS